MSTAFAKTESSESLENMLNPYNCGLLLGAECDVSLVNPNGEPVLSADLFTDGERIDVVRCASNAQSKINSNYLKPRNGMVRFYAANAHCRAYSIDNMWHCMKELVVQLKHRATISYLPNVTTLDGIEHLAGGNIRMSLCEPSIYEVDGRDILELMFDPVSENKVKEQFHRSLYLTLGLVGTLLDKRPAAERRRKMFGPGTNKCFRHTDNFYVYQGSSNFWVYHPALAHMMLGAARLAAYMVINEKTYKVLSIHKFKTDEIAKAIRESDYAKVQAIWDECKGQFRKIGHPTKDNPFSAHLVRVVDFLIAHGVGVLGTSVYSNWRMKRKRKNYVGHLGDVRGWESGVASIFDEEHPLYDEFKKTIKV
ncbi:MAG: hypothetical protein MN733_32610 [Nitrososphaera sp.]|nr:hypothetical protein [Nitrososphaera sp.]